MSSFDLNKHEFLCSRSKMIFLKKSNVLFGCLYRHPRRTKGMKTNFIEKLYTNLETYADKNVPIVLLGDVNINIDMSDDSTVQSYTDMLASVGCRNLINIPTNFWKTGRSTLDHPVWERCPFWTRSCASPGRPMRP